MVVKVQEWHLGTAKLVACVEIRGDRVLCDLPMEVAMPMSSPRYVLRDSHPPLLPFPVVRVPKENPSATPLRIAASPAFPETHIVACS